MPPSEQVAEEAEAPRPFFARELQHRREALGMSQAALAERIVMSPQMVAHFEAGRRKPQLDTCKLIDQALGTDGLFYRMRKELEESRFADHFKAAAEAEALATVMRLYGATLVPGLLQTARYAEAVFRAGRANSTDSDVEERMNDRIKRARILSDPKHPVLWAVLDENVLRRVVGSRGVMAEQLRHIAGLARSGRLRLHVLPFEVGAHALMESMVVLMRFSDAPPVAYVEGLRTGKLLEDPAVVADCTAAYDLALGDALSKDKSLALLEQLAEEYEHDQPVGPRGGEVAQVVPQRSK